MKAAHPQKDQQLLPFVKEVGYQDRGISTSGWTRYQAHETEFDLNIYLDSHGEPQYIRSVEGHSGVPRIDPLIFTLLEIPYA